MWPVLAGYDHVIGFWVVLDEFIGALAVFVQDSDHGMFFFHFLFIICTILSKDS